MVDATAMCEGSISEEEWLTAQEKDTTIRRVMDHMTSRWPPVRNLHGALRSFQQVSSELTIEGGFGKRHELEVTGQTPFYLMRGRRCMGELTPKFNKWYDMREESEGASDERLRVKERIMAKQESNKRYADNVNRAKNKNIVKGDWVLVKKTNKVMKGESVFQTSVRVQGVTRGAVCLEGRGWRSKDDIIRLKAGQEEIIMRGSRACGAESTDDEDEWQGRGARDVVSSDEECVNTSPMRERIGHGSAERCEKAWRGLTDVEGQNGSRPEPAKSDSHNVMRSDQEDACAVRGLSFLNVYSLLTSRPIRIEDSRNVRGRREAQEESGARRRDSAVLSPAPRGPCC
ncbi:hypothetical protein NDU88_008560 [Pleurodeles waltl]|uniref:Uncharacterized protein n=1 Tax=Pleurodeles waltl TaxID=8319 RepID=A0AAV7QUW0_PLEWA|nr:hypothetical protein NDU88_008560 [Pleurodeles waltl]